MTNLEEASQNGVLQTDLCPVCSTKNEDWSGRCKVCSWYLPMKDHPSYELELSRAKQQFQMVDTFNQVLTNMQIQNKMLEKISFRMDGLEGEVNQLKEQRPATPSITQKYEYPPLPSILTTKDFDSAAKRKEWWKQLEDQWKKAFNVGVLQKNKDHQPNEEELTFILTSPVLRLVGPRGLHANLDFELTNLSGIRHLTNLTLLVCSHHAFSSLAGIEHLSQLQDLFVQSNKITHLKEVYYLPQLKKLYVNVNQITDLHPLEKLTNLEVLYCNYNQLSSLEGITPEHVELKEFYCLPNDKVKLTEIKRVEALEIKCRKG